jgi:hypothetical protein
MAPATGAINWNTVLQQALAAAEGVLGQKWQGVSQGAISQIRLLTNTAEYIAENKDNMRPVEAKAVVANQSLALQNVLLIYEDIGIATAEQVVQAVWTVIGGALQTAAGVAIKV